MELEALNKTAHEFQSHGAQMYAVTLQSPEFNREVVKKYQMAFEILSDEGGRYCEQLGLVFELPSELQELYDSFGIKLNEFNSDGTWRLPMPARYIVGQDGIVFDAEVNPDYTVRPEPDETLDKLQRLQLGSTGVHA